MAFPDWARRRSDGLPEPLTLREERRDEEDGQRRLFPFLEAVAPGARFTVPYNEKADIRTRRHEQVVADLLNALLRTTDITGGSPTQARLGYTPSVPSDWEGESDTMSLAAALAQLANPAMGGISGAAAAGADRFGVPATADQLCRARAAGQSAGASAIGTRCGRRATGRD